MAWTLEPLADSLLDHFLPRILAAPETGVDAAREHVIRFRAYIAATGTRLRAWQARAGDRVGGALLALLLPGRSALCIAPPLSGRWADPAAQAALLPGALADLAQDGLRFAQALLAPGAAADQACYIAAGFSPLTTLDYLERPLADWRRLPPLDVGLHFLPFSEPHRPAFENLLLDTYADSADCPELSRLRSAAEALEAHRAAGVFDPNLWFIAQRHGVPAACAMLARSPFQRSTVELVYMGVAKPFRGIGLGRAVLTRAAVLAARSGAAVLTLAADQRNAPALRLYQRFGLARIGCRDALLFTWS